MTDLASTRWTAQIMCVIPGLSPEDTAEIAHNLGGQKAVVDHSATVLYDNETASLDARFEVDSDTLQSASAVALKAAAQSLPVEPSAYSIQTTAAYLSEQAHPKPIDLWGVAEISAHLGISRQRVYELADTAHGAGPNFPKPVAKRLWTRTSICEFEKNWVRIPGNPHRAKKTGEGGRT
ncbi:Uncharacterised protein [Mycobacteroides abscessus subsp. massiliense]|uniref:hypothetical protein n=1 Tax=Mycobacteroides abscessus TaxID=36809 RepID=UPI0009A5FA29|nr:hypothetical protein [Mycobacteroides abscessus]MBE5502634.1 hypothetical protein [Mycobacteroides abscessus]SLH53042.1 Uncharacterised protein [Mycobacteroides abscessus subsp. massiliense]